jgi:Rad3-related DNA helicase
MGKKLLMSATILDHEMLGRYLGVEKEDIKFIRVSESTFPIKNRPLIQDYQGKATHKTMDAYLSKMLQRIDDYYIPNKMVNKGVVHTHSHKIARYILANSKYKNMMVSNTDNEGNRDEIFQEFFDSKPPKVMVSCSMDLGVDLFDERCRWQLICKIPYPDMNDPQIKKRMEREPDWYDYRSVVDLIQTYGRACRSETDWAETYVLDSMFAWLVSKNKSIIPKWFMEAIR